MSSQQVGGNPRKPNVRWLKRGGLLGGTRTPCGKDFRGQSFLKVKRHLQIHGVCECVSTCEPVSVNCAHRSGFQIPDPQSPKYACHRKATLVLRATGRTRLLHVSCPLP